VNVCSREDFSAGCGRAPNRASAGCAVGDGGDRPRRGARLEPREGRAGERAMSGSRRVLRAVECAGLDRFLRSPDCKPSASKKVVDLCTRNRCPGLSPVTVTPPFGAISRNCSRVARAYSSPASTYPLGESGRQVCCARWNCGERRLMPVPFKIRLTLPSERVGSGKFGIE
jgi:hypothetical protein